MYSLVLKALFFLVSKFVDKKTEHQKEVRQGNKQSQPFIDRYFLFRYRSEFHVLTFILLTIFFRKEKHLR